MKARYKPATATLDHQDTIKNDNISIGSSRPLRRGRNHYPIAHATDAARRKHVMLEKNDRAGCCGRARDDLHRKRNNLETHHRHSQALRQHQESPTPRRRIVDGTLGKVVRCGQPRHCRRARQEIASVVRLYTGGDGGARTNPPSLTGLLEPAKAIRVLLAGRILATGTHQWVPRRDVTTVT